MDKLILFDIDKTLLKSGNLLHKAAFSQAFKEIFNIEASIDIVEHQGKTDQQIIIDVLRRRGIEESIVKERMADLIQAMVIFFENKVGDENSIVADGVVELLQTLNNKKILIGLVTGNLEAIAWGKMKKAGLDNYFKVGGFGSDDINRANLVKIAITKAENNFGFKFNNNVFLVGDTPRDILAGQETGVKTIGVATGNYATTDLEKEEPDLVLKDLTQKDKILELIEENN
jgi:phosphoglycolate phosphatase-like HAD superfamily hydrolase